MVDATADTLAREVCKRGDRVFSVREPMLGYWDELARWFYPEREDFTTDFSFGREFGDHLFDEGSVTLRRDLANSFASMLRPRSQRWFKPDVMDDKIRVGEGVADWLDSRGTIMWRWMYEPKSHFVRATKSADHDFATFGNAVLCVEPNTRNNGLIYRHFHLRDCAWVENADGEIDTVFRRMKLTARQIRQKWPKAPLHENIERSIKEKPETEYTIWHVMMPMDDYAIIDGADAKKLNRGRRGGFRFASVYIDKDHGEIISQAGSATFRYVIARWHPVQGWPYAISPATSDSLPGARQLQAMARTGIEALEKSIDPPTKAVEDAVRGDINLFAGGITWVDREYDERHGAAMEMFDVGKNAILGLQSLGDARMRLADSMFVTKLTMPTERAKTAYETQRIWEEQLRASIPLFEPVEEGYNAPLLDETWALLMDLGAFQVETMPEALRGEEFRWSFSNPIQESQERIKSQTFQVVMGLLGMAAQVDPAAANKLDVETALDDAMRGAGAPEDWIRDEDEMKALSERQAEQQAMMQNVQMAGAAGEAAKSAGEGAQAIAGLL